MIYTRDYEITRDDYVAAGEVSSRIKNKLKQLGVDHTLIRKIAIASYEAEINMIIHSYGGHMQLDIDEDSIVIKCAD
ncbi:MAG: anti-sigma regulatory factor, partial [Christensenella sp.]